MVKHNQFRRLLETNCLSVFDHFVVLTLKGLTRFFPEFYFDSFEKRILRKKVD